MHFVQHGPLAQHFQVRSEPAGILRDAHMGDNPYENQGIPAQLQAQVNLTPLSSAPHSTPNAPIPNANAPPQQRWHPWTDNPQNPQGKVGGADGALDR